MRKNINRPQRGFTLLEIMIALLIFSIMATITTIALFTVFSSRDRVEARTARLAQLQLAMIILQKDTEQIVNRPILTQGKGNRPALEGSVSQVEFTRSGRDNPMALKQQSQLQRIAYIVRDNQLIRRAWYRLDRVNNAFYSERVMLDGIQSLNFAYLDKNLQVLPTWGVVSNPRLRQALAQDALPKALQMNISLKNWGQMSLLWLIPAGNYAPLKLKKAARGNRRGRVN